MLNAIPVLGWFLSFAFAASLAVPFYFMWNHLAPIYFAFLPVVYKSLPFWDCVWLFMTLSILKHLVPTLVNVSQTNNNKD